jgi:hypothetical protein
MVSVGKKVLTIILKFAMFMCCWTAHICHHLRLTNQNSIEPKHFAIFSVHITCPDLDSLVLNTGSLSHETVGVHLTTDYFGYVESLNTCLNVLVHPSFVVYDDLGILYEFFNNETTRERFCRSVCLEKYKSIWASGQETP